VVIALKPDANLVFKHICVLYTAVHTIALAEEMPGAVVCLPASSLWCVRMFRRN
jgi:hypothetical protein